MTTIREEIFNRLTFISDHVDDSDYETAVDDILNLFKKEIRDLEMEYRGRRLFDLDPKVVFEDIQDILDGKTYKEIFYDDYWNEIKNKNKEKEVK